MRAVSVDERDSTWEWYHPRYRLYVFEGPGNAVATLDITDATIEEALELATDTSNNDEQLWSLALVHDDPQNARGLIWLSGMDYNDIPSSPQDWKLRGHMQNRYLKAKHRRGLPTVLPTGQRVIRVFPEWVSGWPLWENFSEKYKLTGSDLKLSPGLSSALYDWNEAWSNRGEDDPLPSGWRVRGETLAQQLQTELTDVAEIRPEFLT